MANICDYICRIYGKNKYAVEQFANALDYRDMKNGYHFCRIFSANADEVEDVGDGVYMAEVSGDCAWSVAGAMIHTDYGNLRGMNYGEPLFEVFRDLLGRICYANIGVTAPMLCKILGVGFEVWSKEPGGCFQEHYIVNSNGEIECEDRCHWEEGYDEDEDGNFLDYNEAKDEGGFDDYGDFCNGADLLVA